MTSRFPAGFRRQALRALLATLLCTASMAAASAGEAQVPASWPGPDQLFVGACYQPIDRTPAQIDQDIAIMKHAGFTVVRMGDLSWDSFEPAQGKFTFDWFDAVLDKMHAAGIRVILDIPGTPAPIWLHRAYPGVDIVNQAGARLPPAERYMDNISDPDYVREAGILAEAMTKRYAHHPAVIAVGYDNEIGNGFMSYSEADRQRFITWLRAKYGTIDALNKAWATQRWSRRLNDFSDVDLPLADGPGPAERFLDLHRYWSDVTVDRLRELDAIRRRAMPDLPTISNLWDYAPRRGFDYLATYKSYVSYGAEGFYPADPISGAFNALMTKGDLPTPIWFNEFTAGGGGDYGTPGRSRMYAYLGLLMGAQGILAWTFNSHLGGEEQALFGLVDHDGTPSWKVDEFGRIAGEFKRLSRYGFPRHTRPEVAIAYSFESAIASHPNGPSSTTRQYFQGAYGDMVQAAFEPLFKANIDTAIINVGHDTLAPYKLVVIPADYVMDPASAKAVREYVQNGGTVLMTGYSAKVDEHAQWFDTPLPGRLSDVFGLKTNAFYRSEAPLSYSLGSSSTAATTHYYEVLAPTTATVLATFDNTPDHTPAITINKFGKGTALYLATEPAPAAMAPVLAYAYGLAGVHQGPQTPDGVYARVVDGRTLYVNTTRETQHVAITGAKTGLVSNRRYDGTLVLGPWEAELLP
ncbi:beta-galactosidase [Nitrospirillum amazonense]|uniref:beta-galactosidase n=1 Tax=Nitrospirillum amazonense TaxID=28077 RepID=UPI002DD43827|nr:beta-galactosidase [Nitrospirillum amazonense]MEC4594571.1 beta-galactosidase [Nitrospirillum amazonense]